ncbi:Serine/threonine protein kinase [Actinoplanes philippinensis]|uniref:non-specific serine/threonine protein kinase n=1 Tax=Actinoplanes philippinensis TaxID=35752 RepID=A0A1I2A512_9ACTN|nr:Serine/threonine protein kinase [Actinoplanes philippinensis]
MLNGRYRLTQRIAAGGMGEVWRGDDLLLQREIAVKVLLPALMSDADFITRFRSEARMMAALRHPGIVQVYDYGENAQVGAHGLDYLVMEFIDGTPLSARIQRAGRLGPADTMAAVAQVADALQAAHDAGIIHRDVKPSNLLVRPGGAIVLVDFGVARSTGVTGITSTNVVLGSAHYMAPEQAEGRPVTAATDMYAIGAVAFCCLTGRPPYVGDNPLAVLAQLVHGQPPVLPPDVPAAVGAVVMRALAKDPGRRFPSAAALAAAARAAAGAPSHPGGRRAGASGPLVAGGPSQPGSVNGGGAGPNPGGRTGAVPGGQTGAVPGGRTGTGDFPAGQSGAGSVSDGRSGTGAFPAGRSGAGVFPAGRAGAGAFPAGHAGAGAFPAGRSGAEGFPAGVGPVGGFPAGTGPAGGSGFPPTGAGSTAGPGTAGRGMAAPHGFASGAASVGAPGSGSNGGSMRGGGGAGSGYAAGPASGGTAGSGYATGPASGGTAGSGYATGSMSDGAGGRGFATGGAPVPAGDVTGAASGRRRNVTVALAAAAVVALLAGVAIIIGTRTDDPDPTLEAQDTGSQSKQVPAGAAADKPRGQVTGRPKASPKGSAAPGKTKAGQDDPVNGPTTTGRPAATDDPATTGPATNPHGDPAVLCGNGYQVIDSRTLTTSDGAQRGTVYLLFRAAGGKNCVVTIKTDTLDEKTSMSARLEVQGGAPIADTGSYQYYAGPVDAPAAKTCVKWGGSIGGLSYTSDFSHCT